MSAAIGLRGASLGLLLLACGSTGPGSAGQSGGSGGGGSGGTTNADAAIDGPRAGSGGGGGVGGADAGPRADARTLGAGGQIGAGDGVECSDAPGGRCNPGSICCNDFPDPDRCVARFSECACAAQGECGAVACDGPEDCPGAVCCAARNYTFPIPEFDVVSCKAACGEDEYVVCRQDSDCPRPGQDCGISSFANIKRCFF